MAEDHDQPRPETLGGELDAANLRGRDDVAGDADDEEVSQALIEYDFRGHGRIGASQYDRERILARHELGAPALARKPFDARDAGDETPVSFDEARQGLRCRDRQAFVTYSSNVLIDQNRISVRVHRRRNRDFPSQRPRRGRAFPVSNSIARGSPSLRERTRARSARNHRPSTSLSALF
jgi:hypothetical protein